MYLIFKLSKDIQKVIHMYRFLGIFFFNTMCHKSKKITINIYVLISCEFRITRNRESAGS